MLVRITKKSDGNWSVVALSGRFYQQQIAEVEAIRLRQARFQKRSITGRVAAVWGADVRPEVFDDFDTVQALGIGTTVRFEQSPKEAAYDVLALCWYDVETQQQLTEAYAITATGEHVYYATKREKSAPQLVTDEDGVESRSTLVETPQPKPETSFFTKVRSWIGRQM